MRLTIILGAIICLCLSSTIIVAISLSKHGCPEKCGNVTIPYPFGIGSECSGNSSFTVICQNSTTPILSRINMEALYISLQGMIRVKQPVSPMTCSNVTKTHSILAASLVGSPFTISTLNNSLVNLGCSNAVWLRANKTTTIGGCMAICDANARDTSCNGVNCCQITVPPRLKELQYTYQSVQDTNNSFPCGYAFLVDKKWFRKDYKRYKGLQNNLLNPFDQEFRSAPLILEWEWEIDIQVLETTVGVRCSDPRASESAKAILNYCGHNLPFNYRYLVPNEIDVQPAINYCYCADGYEGNPYLPGGCRYIYECSNATLNGCPDGRYYINKMGYYCCLDTSRTSHKSNSKKRSRVKIIVISTTFSVLGAIILVVGAWRSIKAIKALTKRIKANRRRKFFKRNGGLLLQQHLSSSDKHGVERTKLFSSKELARATDRYSENRILGRGGQGTVYKGMLTDGKIVAVKKPNDKVHEGDVEIFINEVVILSQINHRNVVRLLGCCLETQVPLLVYEFITNGTLFQHIHHPDEEFFPLSWEVRLRIARDIAGALSYMHSAAYAPIYHRDIKSTNILLDEKYRAKVSDFGTSRTVSIDQTHLTTRVLGTFGYLDPEYFQSSQFTEKSDVYSFGVVMVELLTGEKAISSIRADSGKSLATHFLHSMEEDILFDIVDARVLKQGTREEIMAFAQVARSCLHLNGKRRPTMKEVAYELEGVQLILKETDSSQNNCVQDHDYILSEQHATEIAEWGDDFCSISGR